MAIECNIIITSIIHSKSWKGRERVVKKYDTQRPHVDPRQSMGGRNREKIRFEGNKIGCTAYNHEQKHHMTVSLV